MPKPVESDENLHFLYACLKSSDYTKIDFRAVGTHMNIKDSAARMRFSRLRKAIEDSEGSQSATASALIPTTTTGPVPAPAAAVSTKRKKGGTTENDKVAKKLKVAPNVDETESAEHDEGD